MAKKRRKVTGLVFPKVVMITGAVVLAIYAILIAIFKTKQPSIGKMYGDPLSWPLLGFIAIMYILIPLSVKLGIWTLVWGIIINAMGIIFLIGVFIDADYKSYWTYIGAIPYVLLTLGSGLWAATSYKNRK